MLFWFAQRKITIMWNALSGSLASLLLPSHLITVIILLGIVLVPSRFKRCGWRLIVIGSVVLVTVGILPVGNALVWTLEKQFPDWSGTAPPTAIILVQEPSYSDLDFTQTASSLLARNAAHIAVLARRFPQTPIDVMMDAGRSDVAKTQAESLRKLIRSFGLSSEQVKIENDLHDLTDIVKFYKESLPRNTSDRWLLVAPAIQMPLFISAFRRQDLPVAAYPTDRRIKERRDLFPLATPISGAVVRLDIAVYEWARLLSYWLTAQA